MAKYQTFKNAKNVRKFQGSKIRKKQVQESLVHGLLEKLHPDSISLQVTGTVGTVDKASAEVKAREKREEEERAIEAQKSIEKKRVKKMRGKDKAAHREGSNVRQQHEAL